MKIQIRNLITVTLILFITHFGFSQTYSIAVIVKEQPAQQIKLGLLKGDNVLPLDSSLAENGLVRFELPKDALSGMYRLNFGQTKSARVLNEDPQMLDFIFNQENIVMETNFESPQKSARVIESQENKVWFNFNKKMSFVDSDIKLLEKEVNLYWKRDEKDKAITAANQFNQFQLERDLLITQIAKENSELLVSQFILASKTPLLDGYLTEEERRKEFQNQFFNALTFNNEALIYSQVYTDKIFEFLVSFNDKSYTADEREKAYKKAVDMVLNNTSENKIVKTFITEYLIYGFKLLEMENIISYIKEHD